MTDQPTSIPPATPSGSQEDHRISTARWALAASVEAASTDVPAAQMWGRVEAALQGLLEAIDEGKAAHADAVHNIKDVTVGELLDRAEDEVRVATRNLNTAQELLDEVKAMKERRALDVLQGRVEGDRS